MDEDPNEHESSREIKIVLTIAAIIVIAIALISILYGFPAGN